MFRQINYKVPKLPNFHECSKIVDVFLLASNLFLSHLRLLSPLLILQIHLNILMDNHIEWFLWIWAIFGFSQLVPVYFISTSYFSQLCWRTCALRTFSWVCEVQCWVCHSYLETRNAGHSRQFYYKYIKFVQL